MFIISLLEHVILFPTAFTSLQRKRKQKVRTEKPQTNYWKVNVVVCIRVCAVRAHCVYIFIYMLFFLFNQKNREHLIFMLKHKITQSAVHKYAAYNATCVLVLIRFYILRVICSTLLCLVFSLNVMESSDLCIFGKAKCIKSILNKNMPLLLIFATFSMNAHTHRHRFFS